MREYIDKQEARATMKSYRKSLDASNREVLCRAIYDNVIKSGIINSKTKYILSFASYGTEPDTGLFDSGIRRLYKTIRIAYPKVLNDRKNMEFYIPDEYKALKPGYMNIPEPDGNNNHVIPEEDGRYVMIVPGLAFDMDGARAGYGGGFYDRYLGRYPHIVKAAICFDEQLLKDKFIIRDEHDILMDYIITDKNVVNIKGDI